MKYASQSRISSAADWPKLVCRSGQVRSLTCFVCYGVERVLYGRKYSLLLYVIDRTVMESFAHFLFCFTTSFRMFCYDLAINRNCSVHANNVCSNVRTCANLVKTLLPSIRLLIFHRTLPKFTPNHTVCGLVIIRCWNMGEVRIIVRFFEHVVYAGEV